jgi:hypothetical protein
MSLTAKLRRAPLRIATGAYILNSGLEKFSADDDHAKGAHGMAAGAYPPLEKVDSKVFIRGLATAETAVGAALLLPVVPAAVAGLGLVGLSAGLLGMYWRTPGLHQEGSPRPTQQGIPIAKDSWLLGIGTSLVLDALFTTAHEKRVEKTHELKQTAAVTGVKAGAAAKSAKQLTAAKAAGAGAKAAEVSAKAAEVGTAAQEAMLAKAAEVGTAAQEAMLAKAAQAAALAAAAREASKKAMEHIGH